MIQVVVEKLMLSLGPRIIKSTIEYGVASELELHVGFGKMASAWLCKVIRNHIDCLSEKSPQLHINNCSCRNS